MVVTENSWNYLCDEFVQGPGSNPDEVVEKNNVLNNETTQENTKKKPTTCRNSVQGKIWIADDQGKNFSKISFDIKFKTKLTIETNFLK